MRTLRQRTVNSLRRSLAIARNDLALLRRESLFVIVLVAMPVVIITFGRSAYAAVLHGEGYKHANGAEQVVPGMALMFVFFMVTFAGLAFFREHMWNTWDRMRMLPVRNYELMLGKVVPAFLIICFQQTLVFGLGYLIFGLHIRGSLAALIGVDLAFAVWLIAFILATVAICRTFQQVLAVSNLGAILFAGLGGALAPVSDLPRWVTPASHVTPIYWAMSGFNSVLLDGKGLSAVLAPISVLIGCALLLTTFAAWRFRMDTRKTGALPGL
jgi:ABC-2 type transport system permease protein